MTKNIAKNIIITPDVLIDEKKLKNELLRFLTKLYVDFSGKEEQLQESKKEVLALTELDTAVYGKCYYSLFDNYNKRNYPNLSKDINVRTYVSFLNGIKDMYERFIMESMSGMTRNEEITTYNTEIQDIKDSDDFELEYDNFISDVLVNCNNIFVMSSASERSMLFEERKIDIIMDDLNINIEDYNIIPKFEHKNLKEQQELLEYSFGINPTNSLFAYSLEV